MSKDIKVSSTRISSFLACKQKYFFNYFSKMPKLSNPSFKLGTAVHESLELAGQIWKNKEKFSDEDIKSILAKYDSVSISEGIEDYEVHSEGRELVSKRLRKFLTGSKIIGLEIKFGFWGADSGNDITSKYGVPVMGAIDKVEVLNDETIIIIDYKTSKTAPTGSQMQNDIQLSLYDMVARQMYPQYKRIVLALDLLKHDMIFTYRTDKQREDFELYLKSVYDQMLALKEEDVKASLNMFCPWCDFKDLCSSYKKVCEKSDYTFLPLMGFDNDQLISEWETVKSVKKILESRERELGMVMMEKIKVNASNLKGAEKEIYVKQNSSTNYNLNTVYDSVPSEDFPSLVNLNKKAVETYMSMNSSVKDMITNSATTNHTSPFLASRKIKK